MPHVDGLPDDDGAGPDHAGRILHNKKARASALTRAPRKPSNWWAFEREPWKRVGADIRAARRPAPTGKGRTARSGVHLPSPPSRWRWRMPPRLRRGTVNERLAAGTWARSPDGGPPGP
jgi:hypothetical protein